MSVFNEYARYYDLLYSEKDYIGESEYVQKLIQAHCPKAKTILNLGCGSGQHDRILAKKGYTIIGVDFSKEMLEFARHGAERDSLEAIDYMHGDIRSISLERTFDVIISLFHVMSYQVTNEDITGVFASIKRHLKRGGIFIFDFWYGPGVLTDLPVVRVKEIEDEYLQVIRIARPKMVPNKNIVEVDYRVHVHEKKTGICKDFCENHAMRYLFFPELEILCNSNKLAITKFLGWLSDSEPGIYTWYACVVCQHI